LIQQVSYQHGAPEGASSLLHATACKNYKRETGLSCTSVPEGAAHHLNP